MRLATKLKQGVGDTLNTIRQAFRAKITSTKSDQKIQSIQVDGLKDEKIQDVEHYQDFGFTSRPPAGTNAIILPLNGSTSHGVIIATENGSFRVQGLKSGETCIYDESGSTITLKNDKIIDIECDELNINTKKYTLKAETSDVDVSETITQKSGGQTSIESGSIMDIKAGSAMILTASPSILLDTPMTIIGGGITAGNLGRSTRGAGDFKARFNLPVEFLRRADFMVPVYAVDIIINGISHKAHLHIDSLGGDTDIPKSG